MNIKNYCVIMYGSKYFISTDGKFIDLTKKKVPCFTTILKYWDGDFKIIIYPENNITFGLVDPKYSKANSTDAGLELKEKIEAKTGGGRHIADFTSNLPGVEYIIVNKHEHPEPIERYCDWYITIIVHMCNGEEKLIKFNETLCVEFAAMFPYVAQYHMSSNLGALYIDDKVKTIIGNETMDDSQIEKAIKDELFKYGSSAKWLQTKTIFDYPNTIRRLTDYTEFNNATRKRVSGVAEMYIGKKSVLLDVFVLNREVKIVIGSDKCTATLGTEMFTWDNDIQYNIPGAAGAKRFRMSKFADVKKATDASLIGIIVNTVNMLRAKTQFYAS